MRLIVICLFIFFQPFLGLGQTSFSAYFKKCRVQGSTTIFDYKNKRWVFSDSLDARKASLPASTFKIINSLIALETNVIKDENQIIKWDGRERGFNGQLISKWNKDTDLKSAFKNSTVWFYVELAKRIGRSNYKQFLKKCKYGNLNLSEKGTDFWNHGELKISPVNQIKFLITLKEEKLPFSKANMATVKDIMIMEKTDQYILYGKTGWTQKNGKDLGWWIGYLEKGDNTYFFATRLKKSTKTKNAGFSDCRINITKHILSEMGVLP